MRLQDMFRTERGDMNVYSLPEIKAALDDYRAEILRAAADDVLASDLGPRPGHTEEYGRGWSDATHRASSCLLARAQKGVAS